MTGLNHPMMRIRRETLLAEALMLATTTQGAGPFLVTMEPLTTGDLVVSAELTLVVSS